MSMKIIAKLRKTWAVFVIFLTLVSSLTGVGMISGGETNVYAVEEETTSETTTTENDTTTEASVTETTTRNTTTETTTDNTNTEAAESTTEANVSNGVKVNTCKQSMGSLGWAVCPIMEKTADAVDWLYDKIEDILLIDPISAEEGSPMYEIWKYCLGLTNIVFIIFLIVVIYSQITGLGINNYGLK